MGPLITVIISLNLTSKRHLHFSQCIVLGLAEYAVLWRSRFLDNFWGRGCSAESGIKQKDLEIAIICKLSRLVPLFTASCKDTHGLWNKHLVEEGFH